MFHYIVQKTLLKVWIKAEAYRSTCRRFPVAVRAPWSSRSHRWKGYRTLCTWRTASQRSGRATPQTAPGSAPRLSLEPWDLHINSSVSYRRNRETSYTRGHPCTLTTSLPVAPLSRPLSSGELTIFSLRLVWIYFPSHIHYLEVVMKINTPSVPYG